jgi:hypothetical protein
MASRDRRFPSIFAMHARTPLITPPTKPLGCKMNVPEFDPAVPKNFQNYQIFL